MATSLSPTLIVTLDKLTLNVPKDIEKMHLSVDDIGYISNIVPPTKKLILQMSILNILQLMFLELLV